MGRMMSLIESGPSRNSSLLERHYYGIPHLNPPAVEYPLGMLMPKYPVPEPRDDASLMMHVDRIADERNRAEEDAAGQFYDEPDEIDPGDQRQFPAARRLFVAVRPVVIVSVPIVVAVFA